MRGSVGGLLLVGVLVALNWHLMWLAFAVAAAIVAALVTFLGGKFGCRRWARSPRKPSPPPSASSPRRLD